MIEDATDGIGDFLLDDSLIGELGLQDEETAGTEQGEKYPNQDKSAEMIARMSKQQCKRILSEKTLDKMLPWHFEKGMTYHCISFGDIDSLSYLRVIVKQQPLEYCILSTWCMAMEDCKEIEGWIKKGYIKRVDFYVGEIFKARYSDVFEYIKENCLVPGARIAIFRNHSKVMAGYGRQFDFAIASSANVNTNPRCENTTITIDTEVADFYKAFFDGINGFNKDSAEWTKYELDREGRKE